jgi:hypothetical protein
MGDDDLSYQNVYDDDEFDASICRVYDKNDFFTILVQLLLGLVAVLSLYIKRLQEVPRRTFGTLCFYFQQLGLFPLFLLS